MTGPSEPAANLASAPSTSAGVAPRAAGALALGLAAVGLVANGIGLAVSMEARNRGLEFSTPAGELATSAFVLTLVVVGLLLRRRRPDHRMGWLLLAFGAIAGVSSILWSNMLLALAPGGDRQLGVVGSWLGGSLTVPVWTYCVTALVVCFPSGRPETLGEARILRWTAVIGVVAGLALAVRPGPIPIYPAFDNPIVTPDAWRLPLLAVTSVAVVATLGPGFAAVAAMAARYRRASAIERLQLRWFAFGAALVVVASLGYVIFGTLLSSDRAVIREGTYTLFLLSLCSLPVAVAIAITRYRLYDIDTIIGRTVAYGALTAILAGLYAASVRLFNALFVAVTGEESEAALVLTTLVLATTFTPIKGRLERLAAKRFPPEPHLAGTPAVATVMPVTEPPAGGLERRGGDAVDELDARIEAIARRVAREVVAEGRRRPGGR